MNLAKTALLVILASAAAGAQVNVGEQKPEADLPFTMTTVATFELPWRIAFLPDGRMLVTEKIGPVWLVSPQGQKIGPVANTPAGLLAGSERHAWRVRLAPLRHRPEHLSHLCRAGRLRRRPGAGPREAERHRHLGETGKLRGAVAPDAQGQGRPGRRGRWPSRPTASICSSRWATASASRPPRIRTSP